MWQVVRKVGLVSKCGSYALIVCICDPENSETLRNEYILAWWGDKLQGASKNGHLSTLEGPICGGYVPRPQWMFETLDRTLYILCFFLNIHTYDKI